MSASPSPPAQFEYDFAATVEYSDDDGYRAAVSRQFGADPTEQDRDDFTFINRVDAIFHMVREDECFKALTEKFSQQFIIGELAMVSFDHFANFHACLRAWRHEAAEWSERHPAYLRLHGLSAPVA